MDKYYYSEKLNDYLLDKLSESEKNLFEQLLDKDPILKQDCQLQKEIVEGIHQFRKDQLKARFNRIDVTDTPSFYMPQWAKVSSIAASLLAGAMAVYLYVPVSIPETQKKAYTQEEKLDTDLASETIHTNEKDLYQNTLENQEKEKLAENTTSSLDAGEKTEKPIQIAPTNKETEVAQTQTRANIPKRQKAVIATKTGYQKVNFAKNNLKISKISTIRSVKKQNIASNWLNKEVEEVKGVFDGSEEANLENISIQNKLSYQYYDEEVFFYNHYDKNAKVIQVELDGEQKRYFYHDAQFYEIKPNQIERTEAAQVQDPDIISKLKKELNMK